MMSRTMTCGLAFVALSCDPPRAFDTIRLDGASTCAAVSFQIDDVEPWPSPWSERIATSVDNSAHGGRWTVGYPSDSDGRPELRAWHSDRNGQIDAERALYHGRLHSDATLEIQSGATPREAWITITDAEGMTIHRLEVGDPSAPEQAIHVSSHIDHLAFPKSSALVHLDCPRIDAGEAPPCDPRSWHRRLGFVGGVPHLIAVADASLYASTTVVIARLTQGLALRDVVTHTFVRACDDAGSRHEVAHCNELNQRIEFPSIEVMGMTGDPAGRTLSLFLLRHRTGDGVPETWEPAVIAFERLGEHTESRFFVHTYPWIEIASPQPRRPAGIVTTDQMTFILFDTRFDGALVVRLLHELGARSELAFEGLAPTTTLFALPEHAWLSSHEGPKWVLRSLQGGDVIGEFEATTDIVALESAGHDAMLVRTRDDTTLVRVSCQDE